MHPTAETATQVTGFSMSSWSTLQISMPKRMTHLADGITKDAVSKEQQVTKEKDRNAAVQFSSLQMA